MKIVRYHIKNTNYTNIKKIVTGTKILLYHNISTSREVLIYKNSGFYFVYKNMFKFPFPSTPEKNIYRKEYLQNENNFSIFSEEYIYKWRYDFHKENTALKCINNILQEFKPNEFITFGMSCSEKDIKSLLLNNDYFLKNSSYYKTFKNNFFLFKDLNMSIKNASTEILNTLLIPDHLINYYQKNSCIILIIDKDIHPKLFIVPIEMNDTISESLNETKSKYPDETHASTFIKLFYYFVENINEKMVWGNNKIEKYFTDYQTEGNEKTKKDGKPLISEIEGFGNDFCDVIKIYCIADYLINETMKKTKYFLLQNSVKKIIQFYEKNKFFYDKKSDQIHCNYIDAFLHINSREILNILNSYYRRNGEKLQKYLDTNLKKIKSGIKKIFSNKFYHVVNFNGIFSHYIKLNQQFIPFNSTQTIEECLCEYFLESKNTNEYIIIKSKAVPFIFTIFLDFIKLNIIEKKIKNNNNYILLKLANRNEKNIIVETENYELIDIDIDYASYCNIIFKYYFIADHMICSGNTENHDFLKNILKNKSYKPIIHFNIYDNFHYNDISIHNCNISISTK